jgi:tetratricopeptide (TPR) repeat protein
MRNPLKIVLPFILVFLVISSDGWARKPYDYQLRLAEGYKRAGDYQKALAIYERLHVSYPKDKRVREGLKEVYFQTKSYAQLTSLLSEEIEEDPKNPNLHKELGQVFFSQGKTDEAKGEWERIIELSPDEKNSYLLVAVEYGKRGMIEDAVEIYLQGRKALGKPELFSQELTNLYEIQGNYGRATREQILWLLQKPKKGFHQVGAKLKGYVNRGGGEETVGALRVALLNRPQDPELNYLLADLLSEVGLPQEALIYYQKVDGLKEDKGKLILSFASESLKKGYISVSLEAYGWIMERYPELGVEAMMGMGDCERRMGQPQKAIQRYREAMEKAKNKSLKAEALYRLGMVELKDLKEPEAAAADFGRIIKDYRETRRYLYALLRQGDSYLLAGQMDKAREFYKQVKEGTDLKEEAEFQLCQIDYFEGNFDEAQKGFVSLAKEHLKGIYANDALEKSIFIEDHKGQVGVLGNFAQAELLVIQGNYSEATDLYRQVADMRDSTVSDFALFALAQVLDEEGRYREAMNALQELEREYPGSQLADRAQERIAFIWLKGLNNPSQAIEALQDLLTRYPESILADEARTRIRRLKESSLP